MSEVEKMYENAGVEKEVIKGCYEYYTEYWGIDIYTINDCKNKDCNTCEADKSVKEYPPFTAEKQIELCKWLIKNYHRYVFDVIEADSFETDLAKFMNEEWQDLTKEEKTSIKNILEM